MDGGKILVRLYARPFTVAIHQESTAIVALKPQRAPFFTSPHD
jgi:hypothetical protein